MKNISKKIFMEFVFFAIVFIVMIVSNNFIVNNASTKEISLPQVQEYREIERNKYSLDGYGSSAPKIQENLYQISDTQIEGFVKAKNYLPGRIDPFGNPASAQAQTGTDASNPGQATQGSAQQQTQVPSTAPTAAPSTSQPTTTTTTNNNTGSPITSDNSANLDMKELPVGK